jgi:hypothetical protein
MRTLGLFDAGSLLKSPHTVQLYDFGVTEDGTFYYVMELLDGLDLDTLVDQLGPVPVERAVHLLVQACASLEDAHQNGLVHRDIKPRTSWSAELVQPLAGGAPAARSESQRAAESVSSITSSRTGNTLPC